MVLKTISPDCGVRASMMLCSNPATDAIVQCVKERSIAYSPFQYRANAKPFLFRDNKKKLCLSIALGK